jgi:hypothetical protein
MIIGKSFAWGHLGKTGGHTTWELFNLFPEEIEFADPLGNNKQHTPFVERRAEVAGKDLVLNIRQLPAWMLSRHMHQARWGNYPEYEPLPMTSPYEMALSDAADTRLVQFTDHGNLEIKHWLRTEHLVEDFIAFISHYVELTPERRAQILEVGGRNVATYNRRLDHWFSPAHIELMYMSNPHWAAAEARVYRAGESARPVVDETPPADPRQSVRAGNGGPAWLRRARPIVRKLGARR